MVSAYDFYQQPLWMLLSLLLITLWSLFWKGFGLWHSAKNQQKGWFIAILILNTMGLLPILYLIWIKPKRKRNRLTDEKDKEEKGKEVKKDKEYEEIKSGLNDKTVIPRKEIKVESKSKTKKKSTTTKRKKSASVSKKI
jgi:hypothetical protein